MAKLKILVWLPFILLLLISEVFSGELRVVYPKWFPYYYEENGKVNGYEAEIFAEVLNWMDVKANYKQLPWKRCLKMIETGEADVVLSVLKTEERLRFMYYPDEYLSKSSISFFIQKGNEGRIVFDGNFSTLKDSVISTSAGFSYGEGFDYAGLQTDPSPDTESVIKKVVYGRTPVGVENYLVARETARKIGLLDEVIFLKPFFNPQVLYAGFSKKSCKKAFVEKFSEHLTNFKKSEKYADIIKKYELMDNGCK